MLKELVKYAAILTFTLLQCAAPLVHAHIDGSISEGSILVHSAPLPTPSLDKAVCYAESEEAQAITIPHVSPSNETPCVIDSSSTFSYTVSANLKNRYAPLGNEDYYHSTLLVTPPSQAPPKE